MSGRTIVAGSILILIIGAGGYYGYEYIKERPPTFLFKLVTRRSPPPPLPEGDLAPLQAPEGFVATIFARDVPGARVMARDSKGTMLVSETSEGKVVALPDLDNDGKADRASVVLEGLQQPHGLYVICAEDARESECTLYVAETNALKSYRYDPQSLSAVYEKTLAALPSGSGHFTRTLLPHPDGTRLLISVGSSCNVCNENRPERASVLQFDMANERLSLFAKGLRNTVFMTVDPVSGNVWGTDNGRDLIGDDIPPDEVNIIEEGKNYGWPICYGKNVHDTDFDSRQYVRDPCADMAPSHIDLQAHSAALGLAFIPEEGWPADMRNDLLIAYHGSWNRSEPTGYKVVRFDLARDRSLLGDPKDFLTGFLPEESEDTDDAIGRPVDLLAEPGGTLYVSDDRAGAIYKISRTEMD